MCMNSCMYDTTSQNQFKIANSKNIKNRGKYARHNNTTRITLQLFIIITIEVNTFIRNVLF